MAKIVCSCGQLLTVKKGHASCRKCTRTYTIRENGGPISRKKKDVMTGNLRSLFWRFVGVMAIFFLVMLYLLLSTPVR